MTWGKNPKKSQRSPRAARPALQAGNHCLGAESKRGEVTEAHGSSFELVRNDFDQGFLESICSFTVDDSFFFSIFFSGGN